MAIKYKVPFVDFATHYNSQLEEEIIAVVRDVLHRGDFVLRGDLQQFEENMASLLGIKHVIGVGSGTDALHLALKAAGIGPGDEVITVAFTCMATISVIAHCGADPILIDVRDDYNMDPDQIEKAISPCTRAILPVHLNGRSCDMEKIMDIATRHNLMVIEDAAQSPGACFNGQKVGTFGLAGCFSVYPMKMFGSTGDGGFITTNDEEVDSRLRTLRDLGQERVTGNILFHGFSSRLDNIQAAILNVKLKYLSGWIEHRRKAAALFHQGLSGCPYLKLPPPPENDGPYFDVFQNFVIRAEARDKLVAYLEECSIETLTSWYLSKPLHYHKPLNLEHFHLSNTEQFAKESISLPLNAEIRDEQVEFVVKAILDFYKGQ